MNKIIAVIVALPFIGLLIAGLIFYLCFAWGYVASIFWGWFILPLNLGIPNFTIMQFVGISLVIGCFIHSRARREVKKEYSDNEYYWIEPYVSPWIALACGWVIHLFY